MKKTRLISMLCSIAMALTLILPVSAANSNNEDIGGVMYSAQAQSARPQPENGRADPLSLYVFQSVDDDGLNTTGIPFSPRQSSGLIANIRTYTSSWTSAGYNDRIYANGDLLDHCVFVKHLTGSWAKASSYTWSTANTCTWSFSGQAQFGEKVKATLGLSASRTTTYSVATTVPANSSKNSKLAFGSDYFWQNFYVHRDILDANGKVTETKTNYDSGWTKTPTVDSYLYVVYQ